MLVPNPKAFTSARASIAPPLPAVLPPAVPPLAVPPPAAPPLAVPPLAVPPLLVPPLAPPELFAPAFPAPALPAPALIGPPLLPAPALVVDPPVLVRPAPPTVAPLLPPEELTPLPPEPSEEEQPSPQMSKVGATNRAENEGRKRACRRTARNGNSDRVTVHSGRTLAANRVQFCARAVGVEGNRASRRFPSENRQGESSVGEKSQPVRMRRPCFFARMTPRIEWLSVRGLMAVCLDVATRSNLLKRTC